MFFSRVHISYYILWMGPDQSMDLNSVLGTKAGAGPEEIKQAYRDLVQVWHPDRFAGNPRLQRKAEEALKKINLAYAQALSGRGSQTGNSAEDKKTAARPLKTSFWRRLLRSTCSNLFNSIALECLDFGRPDAARRCLLKSLRLNPKNSAAHYNLGLLNYDLEFYHEAAKCLGRAVALDPEFTDAYYSRGMAYWKVKDFDRASRDFARTLELDPGNKNALVRRNLSNVYLKTGKASAARRV
jgi:tetratricopeptide (TPR) repeat protein